MLTVSEVNDFLDGLRQYRIPFLLKSATNGKWLKASSRPKGLDADSKFLTNILTTNAEAFYLDNRTGGDIVNGVGNKLFTLKNFRGQSLRQVSSSFATIENRKALVFSSDTNTENLDVTITYKGVDGSGNILFFFGSNNVNDIESASGAIDNDDSLVDGVGKESSTQLDPLGWSVYLYVIMDPNDPAIDNSIYSGTARRWANVDAVDATIYNIVNNATRKVPIGDKVYIYNGGNGYYNEQTLGALAFIDTYKEFFVNGASLSNFNELITTNIDLTSDIDDINKSLVDIKSKIDVIGDDAKQARGWSTWAGVFSIIQLVFGILMLIAILVIAIIILVKFSGKFKDLTEKITNSIKKKKDSKKSNYEISSPYNVKKSESDVSFSDIDVSDTSASNDINPDNADKE